MRKYSESGLNPDPRPRVQQADLSHSTFIRMATPNQHDNDLNTNKQIVNLNFTKLLS